MTFCSVLVAGAAALSIAATADAQQQTAITTIPMDQIRVVPAPPEPSPPANAAAPDRQAPAPQAASPRPAARATPREWPRDVVGVSREMGRGVCVERGIAGLAEKTAAEHRGERVSSITRWDQARECRVVVARDALAAEIVSNLPAPWALTLDTRGGTVSQPALPPPNPPTPAPAWSGAPASPPMWSPAPPPGWQPLAGPYMPPPGAHYEPASLYAPQPTPQPGQSLAGGIYDIISLIQAGQALRHSFR